MNVTVTMLGLWQLCADCSEVVLHLHIQLNICVRCFQVKRDFLALLREHADIDRHSRWSDVKKRLDMDPRYKAVESSSAREDWFREYVKALKEERKREKERDREKRDKRENKDKGDKERDREREREKEKEKEKEKEEENDATEVRECF